MSRFTYALDQLVNPIVKKRGFAEYRLLQDWPVIVGPVLAEVTHLRRVVFPKNSHQNGTLYVEVYDSAMATELSYMTTLILEKMAVHFGYRAVSELRFIQHPRKLQRQKKQKKAPVKLAASQQAWLDETIADIEDEELKASLLKLGTHVLG